MTPPTDQPSDSAEPGSLRLSPLVAAQFAYHVRMTAVFALAGEAVESASEAVLAWALLATNWPDAITSATETGAELIDQRVVALSDETRTAAAARARGLALDIQAHFVTVGRQDEATLYAEVAERLGGAVDELIPQR